MILLICCVGTPVTVVVAKEVFSPRCLFLNSTLALFAGLVYGFIQREVIRSAESWKGMYRPEMEEEKSLLRKQVQALL